VTNEEGKMKLSERRGEPAYKAQPPLSVEEEAKEQRLAYEHEELTRLKGLIQAGDDAKAILAYMRGLPDCNYLAIEEVAAGTDIPLDQVQRVHKHALGLPGIHIPDGLEVVHRPPLFHYVQGADRTRSAL
jgi:hypothetical protein